MIIKETGLEGCLIIEPKVFGDERGFFVETYQEDRYVRNGIPYKFVQDNRSRSVKNVLRGLHFQKTKPQGKLVSVTAGKVFDVAVDMRRDSKTFGKYVGVILSSELNNQLFVPPGFAHGFCVLSEFADFSYKCTDYYDPSDEGGLIWNDTTVNIDWPVTTPIVSAKDSVLPTFKDFLLS